MTPLEQHAGRLYHTGASQRQQTYPESNPPIPPHVVGGNGHGPRLVFENVGKAKRPSPFLEDLSSPEAQARRGRASAAKRWQQNEWRDYEIAYALKHGANQREAAFLCGVSRDIVARVKRRIDPETGKLQMYRPE